MLEVRRPYAECVYCQRQTGRVAERTRQQGYGGGDFEYSRHDDHPEREGHPGRRDLQQNFGNRKVRIAGPGGPGSTSCRVERALTYVGLEIVGKLADVLGVDPIEFFRRPARPIRSGSKRKTD